MILANFGLWFKKILITFFASLDRSIYGFIPTIYNLLMTISRTTILTQGQINKFANRIYLLLGVFMLFKVSFSLINYVVNPDDFADKSKGFAALGRNLIISLCMLVLVPYAFRAAYELQAILLEDNTIGNLILGNDGPKDYLGTAGDDMAFLTMNAFFSPNTSIENNITIECLNLFEEDKKINEDCFGVKSGTYNKLSEPKGLAALTYDAGKDDYLKGKNNTLYLVDVQNYAAGMEHSNLGLMFRTDLAVATVTENTTVNGKSVVSFIMDYKYPFSTVVGIVMVLILISFCMDVALRSVKLAFLQLIYPIPVISFIDPKSGKDGLFKKWYKLCFSTYLSLFMRLAALYFAIYVISQVGTMTDVITGAKVSNWIIKLFIIIGVLMFAKQLPKILENLGVKIDAEGFTLNPIKKFEKEAALGKNITGAAAGAAVGLAGGGIFRGIGGAFRGAFGGQGWDAASKQQANINRQLRQAKLDGSTFGGRLNARWVNATGGPGFNNVEKDRKDIERMQKVADAAAKVESTAVEKIQNGEAGEFSVAYKQMLARAEALKQKGTAESAAAAARLEVEASKYLNEIGKYGYIDVSSRKEKVMQRIKSINEATGEVEYESHELKKVAIRDEHGNITGYKDPTEVNGTLAAHYGTYQTTARQYGEGENVKADGEGIHGHLSGLKKRIGDKENQIRVTEAHNQADQKYVEAAKVKK